MRDSGGELAHIVAWKIALSIFLRIISLFSNLFEVKITLLCVKTIGLNGQ